MTPLEYYALLAAIWLAPQATTGLAIALGSVYIALAMIEVAIKIFK